MLFFTPIFRQTDTTLGVTNPRCPFSSSPGWNAFPGSTQRRCPESHNFALGRNCWGHGGIPGWSPAASDRIHGWKGNEVVRHVAMPTASRCMEQDPKLRRFVWWPSAADLRGFCRCVIYLGSSLSERLIKQPWGGRSFLVALGTIFFHFHFHFLVLGNSKGTRGTSQIRGTPKLDTRWAPICYKWSFFPL